MKGSGLSAELSPLSVWAFSLLRTPRSCYRYCTDSQLLHKGNYKLVVYRHMFFGSHNYYKIIWNSFGNIEKEGYFIENLDFQIVLTNLEDLVWQKAESCCLQWRACSVWLSTL